MLLKYDIFFANIEDSVRLGNSYNSSQNILNDIKIQRISTTKYIRHKTYHKQQIKQKKIL